jgi:hypothetical protein
LAPPSTNICPMVDYLENDHSRRARLVLSPRACPSQKEFILLRSTCPSWKEWESPDSFFVRDFPGFRTTSRNHMSRRAGFGLSFLKESFSEGRLKNPSCAKELAPGSNRGGIEGGFVLSPLLELVILNLLRI